MQLSPDKIHKLSISKNVEDRLLSINNFSDNFESLPDVFPAWFDLIRLMTDSDFRVRKVVIYALASSFPSLSSISKSLAWLEIHKLTLHNDSYVRMYVPYIVVSIFSVIPEKQEYDVWSDLLRLMRDEKSNVRRSTTEAVSSLFSSIPMKYRFLVWNELIRLSFDEDSGVRYNAVSSLGSLFCLIPEEHKFVAWNNLYRLAFDNNSSVRMDATYSLSRSFPSLPEKNKIIAWNNFLVLIRDNQLIIRQIAADSFSYIFPFIPNGYEKLAWDDLIKLLKNDNSDMRGRISNALLYAVSSINDEHLSLAKDDLYIFINDYDSSVKVNVNYCLGKISVYYASKSSKEIDSSNYLKEAIQFFEKASKGSTRSSPAKFCHLFYRSFDAVLFSKSLSKTEIKTYIVAAKKEVGNSVHKNKLLQIVEQLAEAVNVVDEANRIDGEYQELIKRCLTICDYVDQLMDENKDDTPLIYDLYKKARPSFRATIKELIEDIKEKAENACREAQGTRYENLACSIKKETIKWEGINDKDISKQIERFIKLIKKHMPPEDAKSVFKEIEVIKAERNVADLLSTIIDNFFLILTNVKTYEEFALLQIELSEIKSMLEPIKSLNPDVSEIKENTKIMMKNTDQILSLIKKIQFSLKPGIKEEIQVIVGLSGFGSGAQHVITIPLQDIAYAELRDDLQKYSNKMLDIAKLPVRLKDKIMGYIRKNEDKLEEIQVG